MKRSKKPDPVLTPKQPAASIPTRVLAAFAFVFTALGGTLGPSAVRDAYYEWKKKEIEGMVLQTRAYEDKGRQPARSKGPWVRQILVKFKVGDTSYSRWFSMGRAATEAEATPAAKVGEKTPVWFDAEDPGRTVIEPPEPIRKTFGAAYLVFFGLVGVLSVFALLQRLAGSRAALKAPQNPQFRKNRR